MTKVKERPDHEKRHENEITSRQYDLIRSLPGTVSAHIEPADFQIPVSEYLDTSRYEKELERIFFKLPVLIAVSADLPEPGSFCRRDFLGVPVLLTRDPAGKVSAFLNVCTHRGMVLCPGHETGKGRLMTCPYHAWSFSLDGRLVGVPREQIFKDLDKDAHKLRKLECVESGGLIWVGLDREQKPDFGDVVGALEEDLDALQISRMHLFKFGTYEVNANWKLVMDSMLDTYHVVRLHKNTLAKYFTDAPTVTRSIGPHLVSAAGRANFDNSEVNRSLPDIRELAVLTYNLFPNGIVVLSPDYVSVAILRPVDIGKTNVEYIMLSNGRPADEAMEKKLNKSFALMDAAFGNEDFWAAELGQEGLKSGALDYLLLGGMETQMKDFHDTINSLID